MRDIDRFFMQKPKSSLFHYTGVKALMGIAEGRKIFASNAYYLNDSQELLLGVEMLRNLALEIACATSNGDESEFLKQLANWLRSFSVMPYPIFVCSLSEEGSLLSQWRSYTSHGKGVSIAFSSDMVCRIAKLSDCFIAKCIYDRAGQLSIIRELLELLLTSYRKDSPSVNSAGAPADKQYGVHFTDTTMDERFHAYFEGFRFEFMRVFALLKHDSFSEEKEWRIIFAKNDVHAHNVIKFREGASMLVPYVELPLSDEKDDHIFASVTLGPSRHANLSMLALADFLRISKACTRVSNSNLPYREW
jgi:hypothetical protein